MTTAVRNRPTSPGEGARREAPLWDYPFALLMTERLFGQAVAHLITSMEKGMYGNGFNGRQVWIYRWAYEPDTWTELLVQHGFQHIHARIEPAPAPDHVGTLLVKARSA